MFSASAWRHEPEQLGFESLRVKGSHHFLRYPDGRTTVMPIHAGETIAPGLLNSIMRQVKITRDDLLRLL